MIYEKIKKGFPFTLSIFILIFTIAISSIHFNATQNLDNININQEQPTIEKNKEMKAIWVPYMSLEMTNSDYSEASFKEKFDNIIETAKSNNINTLIAHVRPFGDALYPSSYFPWSHIISTKQGMDPGYNPLQYMIESTHKANMELHAWINPLRIKSSISPKELCDNNQCNIWKNEDKSTNSDRILEWENCEYYNPAYEEVRQLIINGIMEIVNNYDIDGIHLDDRFYPTSNPNFDKISYENYCNNLENASNLLSIFDWRLNNINCLITGIYSAIKSSNANVKFGISPEGNIQNSLDLGADVYTWGKQDGYVDYLCPQVYFSLNHPTLPYTKAVDEWKKIICNPNIKFYIGLGIYKAGSDADDGTWKLSNDILKQQIEYGRNISCDGFMLYSLDYLDNAQTKKEIENVMKIFNN